MTNNNVNDRLERAEDELQRALERLSLAQRASGSGVWDLFVDRQTMVWSAEMCELFGVKPETTTVPFDVWRTAVHPDDLEAAETRNASALRDHTPLNSEYRIILPSGQERRIVAYGDTSYDAQGKPIRMIGICVDITDRLRADAAMRASEEKYRALVESTDTGYLIVDGQGRVIDANREYVRLTGHSELAEILGRRVTEWTAEHEKDKNAKALAQCANDGFIRNLAIDYVDGNGRVTPVEINATVIGSGESLRIISLCRDISERVEIEKSLRDMAATLEDKVIQRTRRLRELSGELAMTEERERRLLATELHDNLGQILAVTKMKLAALEPGSTRSEIDQVVELVEQADQSARMITAQLSPPILQSLGLDPALQGLRGEMNRMHGLNLIIRSDVVWDELTQELQAALYRCVRELVINVAKHAKTGEVRLSCASDADLLSIVVSDSGCGFDSARIDTSSVLKHSFGLRSIRERISNLGGEMQIDSSPRKGTTISLSLPRMGDAESATGSMRR